MPARGSGESTGAGGLVFCPSCGASIEAASRYCRACGAAQAGSAPTGSSAPTADIPGEGAAAERLEPPTEREARTEPPTERRTEAGAPAAHPKPNQSPPVAEREVRTEAPGRQPERQGRGRWPIFVAVAIVLGLIGGLGAAVAIDPGGGGSAPSAPAGPPEPAIDPVASLQAHFDRIEQGRFIAASDDLTPALLDSLGGQTLWISERIADLLTSATLSATLGAQSEGRAVVRVDSLRTESLISGCTDFSGSYTMVPSPSGERWLIDSADLVESPC